MIYDAFLFNGEFDILRIRLHELAPVVDQFVIIEATSSITGNPKSGKELFSLSEGFGNYSISNYVVALNRPVRGENDIHNNEVFQRNSMLEALTTARSSDIILVSDVDEIPTREAVEYISQLPKDEYNKVAGLPLKIKMRTSYGYFDLIADNPIHCEYGTVAIQMKDLRRVTPELCRGMIYDKSMPSIEGGYHLSFMGGPDGIRKKLTNYTHPQYNTDEIKANVEKNLEELLDPLGTGKKLRVDDSLLPRLVKEQPQRFERYFYGERGQSSILRDSMA